MNKAQQKRFDLLYRQHVNALRRQGKAANTIEAYGRAVRRITNFFDACPDRLTEAQQKAYFDALLRKTSIRVSRRGMRTVFMPVTLAVHSQ